MLFHTFAEEHGYTVRQAKIEKGETVIYTDKRSAPSLTLRISQDSILINIGRVGGWWAPADFEKACNDLLEVFQKEYGKDRVKMTKD